MLLSQLAERFRVETLVYEFKGPLEHQWFDDHSPEETLIPACDLSVRRLFREDEARCRKFQGFLRSGYFGYFLARRGQWITYGWCTQPGTPAPPHLPRWAGEPGAYWVFYCHTHEEFRGQGHFKRLLVRLVAEAYQRRENPLVLCDTLPGNFPSRSAALQAGFVPAGVLTAYRPMRGFIVGGAWRRDEAHIPRMTAKPAAVPEQAA